MAIVGPGRQLRRRRAWSSPRDPARAPPIRTADTGEQVNPPPADRCAGTGHRAPLCCLRSSRRPRTTPICWHGQVDDRQRPADGGRSGDGVRLATAALLPHRRCVGRRAGGGFHLWWKGVPANEPIVACSVCSRSSSCRRWRLHFWALQASSSAAGQSYGASTPAPVEPPLPGRAVNWVATQVADVTSILEGSDSPARHPGDRNTCTFARRTCAVPLPDHRRRRVGVDGHRPGHRLEASRRL